jgi:hypothetical protein
MNETLELLRRNNTPAKPSIEEDDEAVCPAFGFLRGVRDRALNIEFRREREGDCFSFPYSWLGPSRFHPSVGMVLLFSGSELYLVTIQGRNLNTLGETGLSLYERGILRHRVTYVREIAKADSKALPEGECVVDHIEIKVVDADNAARALQMEAGCDSAGKA